MNAHFLIAQCLKDDNQDLLYLILDLDAMIPEVLAMMHDIFAYITHHRLAAAHPIHQQFLRINEIYNIVSNTIIRMRDLRAIRASINDLATQLRQLRSGSHPDDVIEHLPNIDFWTDEFICLLCIYYQVPFAYWQTRFDRTRGAFQRVCRALALYFHNKDFAGMYHRSIINPREIFALCQSSPTDAPMNYLTRRTFNDEIVIKEQDEYDEEFNALLQPEEDEEDEEEEEEEEQETKV